MNKNLQVRKKTLLHKCGKQWVTIGISAIALLGFNTLYNHASVHASSLNSRLNNAIRENSNQRMTADTQKDSITTANFQQRIQANNNLYQHSHVVNHNNQSNNFIPQQHNLSSQNSNSNVNKNNINAENTNADENINHQMANNTNNQVSDVKNTKPSISFDNSHSINHNNPGTSKSEDNNLVIQKSNKARYTANGVQTLGNINPHYVYPIKDTLLRKTVTNNNGAVSISQQRGFTGKILNQVRYNGNNEYKILWNHQIFYVNSNDVQNTYIQSDELNSHKQGSILPYAKIKMLKPARLYNSVNYNSSTFKKDVHVGQELTVVNLKSFGNPAYHRTRLQLSNGLFVTANKNFVTFA